jgi:hypothetical protein
MSDEPSIDSAREMTGQTTDQQSRRAILHILTRIRTHSGVGYYCGYGTQTFSLLTEAYATLTGEPVERIREQFGPTAPKDPAAEAREEARRSQIVRGTEEQINTCCEAAELLETLANTDILAAPRGRTLDAWQDAARKDTLAGRLRFLGWQLEGPDR